MLDHIAIGFNRVTLDDLIMHATAKEQNRRTHHRGSAAAERTIRQSIPRLRGHREAHGTRARQCARAYAQALFPRGESGQQTSGEHTCIRHLADDGVSERRKFLWQTQNLKRKRKRSSVAGKTRVPSINGTTDGGVP